MKTQLVWITLVSILISGSLQGQETTYKKFPVQVSFIYPIGLHGTQSTTYEYNFSFNILTGYTGSIDGFEIAGLLNANKGSLSGFQIAGIANNTHGNVTGVQIGGLYSVADSLDGLQINGIFSKCNTSKGLQISGIFNSSSSGNAAISGIANINNSKQTGIQLAGIYNQTKELNGVQLGLINIADTITDGIPIGFINLVRRGFYDEWTFSVADYLNLGISYKLGIKKFYTIYTVGMNLMEDRLWVAGLGFGHLSDVNPKFSIQPEIVCYNYYPMDFQRPIRDTWICHFKLGFVKNLNERIALSFAPSIYMGLKSNRQKSEKYGYEQSPINQLFDVTPDNSSRLEYGFGLSAELHLR